jgi:hypothetical protein
MGVPGLGQDYGREWDFARRISKTSASPDTIDVIEIP